MDVENPDTYVFRLAGLKTILAELGRGGKKRLSEKMGGAQNYLSQVESKSDREGLQNIGYELARNIETAAYELGLTRVTKGWLDRPHPPHGDGDMAPAQEPDLPENPVRVVSWLQAGGMEFMDGSDIDDVELANAPPKAGVGTFALRVRGESMVNPAGMQPSYPADCVIIVDPTKRERHLSPVIVKLANVPEATFKMLEIYDGKRYLKPLNPRYPMEPMPEDARIVGVVVRMYYDYVPPED